MNMKYPLFRTLAFALFLPLSVPDAFAGQTVVINNDVNGNVYGNGDGPNGAATVYPDTLLIPNGNTVIINNGTITGFVSGGEAHSAGAAATAVDGNSVIMNGGEASFVYGGAADSASGSATATGNAVFINGGSVTDDVHGGYAGSLNGSATASYNSVIINGGSVNGDVYGGRAGSDIGSATATHNTVTISGNPKFGAGTDLFVGLASANGPTDSFTGNTLNLWTYTGTAVHNVGGIQKYNFILPASLQGLEVTGTAYLGDGAGVGSTITGVSVVAGAAPVQPGDSVTLIDASTGAIDDTGFSQSNVQGKHGAMLFYDWSLDVMGNTLIATLDSVQVNPQGKAFSEGFLGGLALTTQGGDLVAGAGMGNAVNAAQGAGGNGSGFGAFGALSGGSLRYNTGSHVDMNSISLMTGLAWGVDTTPGRLTSGAFFEYGTGSYDTHNSFSNSASVDGDGDTYYTGGGVLGRLDFAVGGSGRQEGGPALSRAEGDGFEARFTRAEETSPTANVGTGRAEPSVIHVEASARMGKAHNEYSSSDLQYNGVDADFDSSSLYYGLHFGIGYLWNITEAASLDLYGKYFWTRQEGDSVTLSTNDPVTFKDADSHRLRVGARFTCAVNEYASPYIGAAYEYEFDGEARATTYGYSIDAPSLKGDTGVGEVGLSLTPSTTVPLSFDLGVQGYTGKREGVTGNLQMKLGF